METFSTLAATTITGSITLRTASCIGELQTIIGAVSQEAGSGISAKEALEPHYGLRNLLPSLEKFQQTITKLETSFSGPNVISNNLQNALIKALPQCEKTVTTINKQLVRLAEVSVARISQPALDRVKETLDIYEELIGRYINILSL